MSSYYFNPVDLPRPKPGQNPLYDHYAAMARDPNAPQQQAPAVGVAKPQQAQRLRLGVAPVTPSAAAAPAAVANQEQSGYYSPPRTSAKPTVAEPAFQGNPHDPQQRLSAMLRGDGDPIHAAPATQQMAPDPSKQMPQIGVPSNSQVQSGLVGVQRQPNWNNPRDINAAARQSFNSQAQEAYGKGDHAGLADVLAQREAWATGGPLAHAQYMQQRDLSRAAAQQKGSAGGFKSLPRNPDGTINEAAGWQYGVDQTNDVRGGEAAQQNIRMSNARMLASQGKPYDIKAGDAPAYIDSAQNQHIAPFFKRNASDNSALNGPHDILEGIRSADPSFANQVTPDTKAAALMIRQLHPDLDNRIGLTADPRDYRMPSINSGYPLVDKVVDALPQFNSHALAGLANLWNGQPGLFNAAGELESRRKDKSLFDALTNPTKK